MYIGVFLCEVLDEGHHRVAVRAFFTVKKINGTFPFPGVTAVADVLCAQN